MASCGPTVLEIDNPADLIHYLLDHHALPSTLVVCSSKAAFLDIIRHDPGAENPGEPLYQASRAEGSWRTPTLRMLSASRTVKVAFCPDITHLRAYLATYRTRAESERGKETAPQHKAVQSILAILNPIQLHRPTAAFSAQGLNRTLSVAIEAAHHTDSKLVVAECPVAQEAHTETARTDPWDEELSILNVMTKRLGELSVGRTVKARTVAERWCTFERISAPEEYPSQ